MRQFVTRFWFVSSITFSYLITAGSVEAQIIPDATLPVNSIVRQQDNTSIIEGGTQAGGNLFHSFQTFSVPTGGEAFFNNAIDIQNIFSRVTGNSISNIDGLIKANGTANLFLINPNGIIFGLNAQLNIGGSFLGSTASSIRFADGVEFSATNPQATPLLTVSVPIGLQYGANPRGIVVQPVATDSDGNAIGLQVETGKSLALVGGTVSLEGGQIFAPGGRVELGGLAGEGTVGLNVNGSDLHLSFPIGVALSDISITDDAFVDVRADGGGSIAINTRLLNISGVYTKLSAGISTDGGSVDFQAGDIDINAVETINLNASLIVNNVEEGSIGNGGNVNITTGSISVTNGGQIQTVTYGQGNAGNVNITARNRVSLDGALKLGNDVYTSTISSEVRDTGIGNSGDINIITNELVVTNGGLLSATIFGQGKAGNVNITAHDRVSFDGFTNEVEEFFSQARSSVQPNAIGDGGNINITTNSLSMTNSAQLVVSTFGTGNAGDVNIAASDWVSFNGVGSNGFSSGIFSNVSQTGVGDGGDINISARELFFTGNAQLNARTQGQGKGGNITINVNRMDVFGGGQVFTTTSSSSQAGKIAVNVAQNITLSGSDPTYEERSLRFPDRVSDLGSVSGLFANTLTNSTNQGGDLTVNAGQLIVKNGARVSVKSEGRGDAGNLSITANSILLDNQGQLIAETASGKGGLIQLRVENLLLMRGKSGISATAENNGDGGNISINAPLIVAFPSENSDIFANADQGNGGNINIASQSILGLTFRQKPTEESDITARSNSGLPGTVTISRLTVNPAQGLVTLPTSVVDASQLIANSCIGRDNQQGRSFIITGRGGLPPRPGDPIDSPFTTGTVRSLTNTSTSSHAPVRSVSDINLSHPGQLIETVRTNPILSKKEAENNSNYAISIDPSRISFQNQLVEARGWIIAANGLVTLVAQTPTIIPHNPSLPSASCSVP